MLSLPFEIITIKFISDTEKGKATPVCHDRIDHDQETGLYPCNDGTNKVDWRDCKDATRKNSDNDNDRPDKTTLIKPTQLSQPQILSIRTCENIGVSDERLHGCSIWR